VGTDLERAGLAETATRGSHRSLSSPLASALVGGALLSGELFQLRTHDWRQTDDFHFYREAVQRFLADPGTLYIPPAQMDLRGFLYPPAALGLFLPFALLSQGAAAALFRVAGVAALVGSVWLLFELLGEGGLDLHRRDRACLVVVALAFGPTFTNMLYGQVNTFVLVDCLAFRLLLARRRPALAGAVLAAGVWLKVYPVLCLVFVLLSGDGGGRARRMVAGFVGGLCGVVLVGLPWVPLSLYRTFFTEILPSASSGTFQNVLNQSLLGAASRQLDPAGVCLDWDLCGRSVVPQTWARILNATLALAALFGLGRWARPGSPARRTIAFLALLAAIPVISPLGWAYVYVMAAPAVLVAIHGAARSPAALVAVMLLSAGYFLPATHVFAFASRLPRALQHAIYDRYLLLTVVVIGWLLWTWRRASATGSRSTAPS
jgi:hypothetical protein